MWKKLLIYIALVLFTTQRIADFKPFCLWPTRFHTTIQPMATQIDLDWYQGKWYEIVRGPYIGEKNCICGEADYKWEKQLQVMNIKNSCIKADGTYFEKNTWAISANPQNTYLQFRFLPFLKANYFILNMDFNYRWVVVGEPCRDYYWILSRHPFLKDDILWDQINLLRRLGFNVANAVHRASTCPKKDSEL